MATVIRPAAATNGMPLIVPYLNQSMKLRLRLLMLCMAAAEAVSAQSISLTGIAYDSLGQRPLPSAILSLGARTAFADSAGRFTFDSVPAGTHRLTMEHPAVDALGLPSIATTIDARAGMDPVRIAIPSVATMWARVCGSTPPGDAGFVFGIVRDAETRAPIRGADVIARWFEAAPTGASVKSWKVESKTDEQGSYALCGLPMTTVARVAASADTARMTAIDLTLAPSGRVVRRDFSLRAAGPAVARGTITGVVSVQGRPLPDVRILTDWTDEVVSGRDGRFTVLGAPVGTRQLYAVPIGLPVATAVVDVGARDTSRVSIAIPQSEARVEAPGVIQSRLASGFAMRRHSGVGYFRDSMHLARYSNFFAAFADLPTAVVQARPGGIRVDLPECVDTPVWLDGVKAASDVFLTIKPADLAGVEIYQRYETPAELRANGVSIQSRGCSILLWTRARG